MATGGGNRDAGGFTASQGNGGDAWVSNEGCDLRRRQQQRGENPCGQPRLADDALDGEGAPRHVRRMLEDGRVACHQGGC